MWPCADLSLAGELPLAVECFSALLRQCTRPGLLVSAALFNLLEQRVSADLSFCFMHQRLHPFDLRCETRLCCRSAVLLLLRCYLHHG